MQEENLANKSRELGAILEACMVLTASFDLEGNLEKVMQTLGRELDMQRGCVFLVDPATEEIRIVAAHGLTREEIARGKYRIGEGIVGSVIKNDAPMYVPDISLEPAFLNKTASRPHKSGVSFISVPIKIGDKVLGVLAVDRIYAEERGGVDDDLRVLRIMASVIAQFVRLWDTYRATDEEKETLRTRLKDIYSLPNVVGESQRLQAVLKSVRKVSLTEATVLLLGESGTGKELIANTIHYCSPRAKGPFVAVNCAALPGSLLDVELFGCERGAFTGATAKRIGRFELAGGGTIFLDEIAELPFDLQAKLLRVLQEKSFERVGSSRPIHADVRVIAATNRDLSAEARAGMFREDLFWRLNVVPIVLPPLRERTGDVRLLIGHYLEKFNRSYATKVGFNEEALSIMSAYHWPGNVRELSNTIERLVIMSESEVLGADDLPHGIRDSADGHGAAVAGGGRATAGGPLPEAVLELEKARILVALKENGFNQRKTSESLGLTQRQLGYRIRKYGLTVR